MRNLSLKIGDGGKTMSNWWNADYKYRIPLMLTNPGSLTRHNEPVLVDLKFYKNRVHRDSIRVVGPNNEELPSQLFSLQEENGLVKAVGLAFLADLNDLEGTYWVYCDKESHGSTVYDGIKQLQPQLEDGVKRLDTGKYILELCRGTGDGTSAGKWGIRYFEEKGQGRNLIKDCSNAIGGFYGPFFTPSNGLVNPPEHTVIQCETEVEGPIYCRYRFKGTIPDGLDPNLKNKNFEIVWQFFYNTPWYMRTYNVDEFNTTVDGMPVSNKITVGDEFESGQGDVVLSRFGSYGGTYYRTGDLYAQILAKEVYNLLNTTEAEMPKGLKEFKRIIGDDINKVSWDYFWRLFCVKEGVLSDEQIISHVQNIINEAHHVVHKSDRRHTILKSDLVDVSAEPDQTIFPMNANKTVELNPETGYAMVWYTSSPVARYQIVQRPASGWVNWGTNGENEYPELPIGSTIYTAYGRFQDWEKEADKMEFPIVVLQGLVEFIDT